MIAISDKLLSVLTDYKAWYGEYKAMHGDKWENSNRVFIGEYGGNIYPRHDQYVDEEDLSVGRT